MTGYATLAFLCAACGAQATANPNYVLSIPAVWDAQLGQYVPDEEGKRQPVCRRCAVRALERMASGDPALTSVHPMLRDPDYLERAYETPTAIEGL